MLRTRIFAVLMLCAACGSGSDSMVKGKRTTQDQAPKSKVILAYEVKRETKESLRTISRRFQVPLPVIEQFNPREGMGRLKKIIYVPISPRTALKEAAGKNPARIVKLRRDEFLRPVKIGDWSALEEENFQSLEDWFMPDEEQRFSFPVEGYISSGFAWRWNRFHKGLDIAARSGTPIVAAQDGRVSFRGWRKGFGLLVIIEHKHGKTYYAHCKTTKVKVGQKVSRGDLIAHVGATGQSRGPHLHFEYRDNSNQPVDPTPFLMPPCSRPMALTAQTARASLSQSHWPAKHATCLITDI